LLTFKNKMETAFKVSGIVPANTRPGEIFLFNVTAHYPKTAKLAVKSVGFLAILVVKDK
jgi:hypothetical protein